MTQSAQRRVRGRARRRPARSPARRCSPTPQVIAGAGNETTGRLIGWLAKVLAEHPDQRRRSRRGPLARSRTSIDETLRFEPTGHATARVRDARTSSTTARPCPAGSADPAARRRRPTATRAATTDPDVFDIHRDDVQHLTFGFGAPLLPRRQPRPPRGPRRARRAPQPLPGVGRRLRQHQARADLDGARLGAHAARHRLMVMPTTSEPVIVVSNDTHIGPRLVEDLRDYCPSKHCDDFDRFAAETATDREAAASLLEGSGYLDHPNFRTAGHHDSAARLADYDHDGVAAGRDLPRLHEPGTDPVRRGRLGRPKPQGEARAGRRRAVDLQPLARRLRGAGTASTHRSGLSADVGRRRRGRRGAVGARRRTARRELPGDARRRAVAEYNRRTWEPLWAACEDLGMPLVTHVGGGTNARYSGLESVALMQLESALFASARGLVDDLRRRLRTSSRVEARDHRDPGQLVPADRGRARHAPRVLRLQARTSR